MVEASSNTDNIKVNLILDAAMKRFGYYGLAKTTMTEIASDVGLSKASIYYYFADKDALFQAVVKREQDGFISGIKKQVVDSKDTAKNKLVQYVDKRHEYFLKVFVNLGKIKMSMENVKPLLGNLLDNFFQSEVALVSDILKEGINNNEFRDIDVSEYADLFIATMNGLRGITIKNKDSYQLEQSDFDLIGKRIKNLGEIFIMGILKNK
ncbi:MAG: TetR/AcrR family transcriptional regulator [Sporocytophaga sp.]|uniref:TetR/AcrR family transcriptional regulator n=1 Tax=Sporocytophaga sp. TaxID=2231183 RepID=UPI001B065624|nr:TetR/AcrR family transcriptional regulator [Sporocytophaga sp.]MBO9702867.1 TetR/AcrR family transcriptional regulator [Sporocytophaga sp.]